MFVRDPKSMESMASSKSFNPPILFQEEFHSELYNGTTSFCILLNRSGSHWITVQFVGTWEKKKKGNEWTTSISYRNVTVSKLTLTDSLLLVGLSWLSSESLQVVQVDWVLSWPSLSELLRWVPFQVWASEFLIPGWSEGLAEGLVFLGSGPIIVLFNLDLRFNDWCLSLDSDGAQLGFIETLVWWYPHGLLWIRI